MSFKIDPPYWELGMDQNFFFLFESQGLNPISLCFHENEIYPTNQKVMDYVRI